MIICKHILSTMRMKCILFITVVITKIITSASDVIHKRNVVCGQISDEILTDILGPAFNSRYMSIEVPGSDEDVSLEGGYKRTSGSVGSFFVDANYVSALSEDEEQPAWTVNHVKVKKKVEEVIGDLAVVEGEVVNQHGGSEREKRAAVSIQRQWECESKIHWIDLGVDYFPRYLRTVECTTKTCWYGHYKCKPRSFTVKILKRKKGRCTVAAPGNKVGLVGLPSDLRELWVWEERAVNFCCDCAL